MDTDIKVGADELRNLALGSKHHLRDRTEGDRSLL